MMHNEELIHNFYTAFQKRDFKAMQDCYADNATFSDAVFKNLNSEQVKNMWEMLIKRGKDLVIEFSNVHADERRGSADWVATYTFTQTGRKVVNRIHAEFKFENGKIVQHNDKFNFYNWAKQAFGIAGLLLGWTSFMKRKVQDKAMDSLLTYSQNK